MLCRPLNWWQVYTAIVTRREMQQLPRETGKMERGQTPGLHEGNNPNYSDGCLAPMPLSWMGPTVHTTRTGLVYDWEGKFLPNLWWKFADGFIAIPELLSPTFVNQFHEGTHLGWTALETILAQHFYVLKLSSISSVICERCHLWAKNNPRQVSRVSP
jgi:hypothetical protein